MGNIFTSNNNAIPISSYESLQIPQTFHEKRRYIFELLADKTAKKMQKGQLPAMIGTLQQSATLCVLFFFHGYHEKDAMFTSLLEEDDIILRD